VLDDDNDRFSDEFNTKARPHHGDAPRGVLTVEDRAQVAAHKAALVALLMASERPQNPQNASDHSASGDIADCADDLRCSAPTTPCSGCGTSAWFWCRDWPEPDTGRWLCGTCARRRAPSLDEVAAGLTSADGTRFDAEVTTADRLARFVLAAVTATREAPARRRDRRRDAR